MTNYSDYYEGPLGQDFPEEVQTVEEVTVEEPISTERIGKVNSREVYIRMNPDVDHDPLGTVKKGEELIILGEENGFYKIETEDGVKGYIMSGYVDLD